MAGYFVANYTITNQADYQEYLESPEYRGIRHLRTDNTEGIGVIAEGK
jgi:uncharacterized protein (DUF1330 family)